jgi:hypothetical protein
MENEKGCCTSCNGTGCSHDVETNGKCWDCRGTGHLHVTVEVNGVITADQINREIGKMIQQSSRFR